MSGEVEENRSESISREDLTELFIDVLKICQPKHPFYDDIDPYKNISESDILTSYCREDSKFHAKCGPRRVPLVAKYSVDIEYFRSRPFFENLFITVHEATHIEIGSHNGPMCPSHPPRFWVEMSKNAIDILDNWTKIEEKWGKIDSNKFKQRMLIDPNSEMVDERSQTPEEAKDTIFDMMKKHDVLK